MTWKPEQISRGTKCLSSFHGSECPGAFPRGFMKWIREMGWLKSNRCYLCAGMIKDPGAFKVDIRPEVEPDLVADATNTGLEPNRFDCVIIDPPYSRELAQKLYKTGEHYHSINEFAKEGARICKPDGHVITLSYEVPRRIKGGDFIAVWGVYIVPTTSYMRCLAVWKKDRPVPQNEVLI